MRGGGENFKKVIDEMPTPVFIFLNRVVAHLTLVEQLE
jgi:hypothetical protein